MRSRGFGLPLVQPDRPAGASRAARRWLLASLAAIVLLGALPFSAPPAAAVGGGQETGAGTTDAGGYAYIGPAQWTRRGSGSGRLDPCSYDVGDYTMIWNFLSGVGNYGGMNLGPIPEPGDPQYDPADWEWDWAFQFCPNGDGNLILNNFFQLEPGEIGNFLLPDLLRQLEIDPPNPVFAPPEAQFQVVGVRTWMWIPEAAATDQTISDCITTPAGVPVACATLTATFVETLWDMGNGDGVTCRDQGEVWRPGAGEQTSCGYVYESDSDGATFEVSAVTEWNLTWTCDLNGFDCTGNPGAFVGQVFRAGLVGDLDVQAWEAQITGGR